MRAKDAKRLILAETKRRPPLLAALQPDLFHLEAQIHQTFFAFDLQNNGVATL
jgi:hypothetical protein